MKKLCFIQSKPTLQTPAYYGHLVIMDSLLCSWGKKPLYIFSIFSPLNMDTCQYRPFLMAPSVFVLIKRL